MEAVTGECVYTAKENLNFVQFSVPQVLKLGCDNIAMYYLKVKISVAHHGGSRQTRYNI